MAENIREFLLRFTEEELIERGVLHGDHKLLRAPSIDPLVDLMKEQGIDKLEFPDSDWFLDDQYNFHNPQSQQKGTNVSELSNRGAIFTLQNRRLNPHFVGWSSRIPEDLIDRDSEVDDLVSETNTLTFGLERDLQKALRGNIEDLELELNIIDGGIERTIEIGRIDITAEDNEGNLVVIELKAGSAQPNSLTQLLAYMGAIGRKEGKPVRGILVAQDFHERVVWGARAIPNVQLKRYSFRFLFEDQA